MKKLKINLLLVLAILFIASSCQKEDEEFIDENNPEILTADSSLSNLLRSASQNNGTLDNIIDGSDCITLEYPVTVIANGQKVTLENEEDIALVEAIFNQFSGDQDTLEILFPITVSFEDYLQLTLQNQAELDALIASCDDTVINTFACVDFLYPITLFTFNSNNEQTGTVNITNEQELFLFFFQLDPDTFIEIQYPVTVIVNGNNIVVNTNQELINAIEQADCSGNTASNTDFEAIVTNGNWYVNYFFDDIDETGDFSPYTFTFNTDGSALAAASSGNTNGTWSFISDSSIDKFDLFFGTTDPLEELDEDWEIIEVSETIIRLKDVSGDGSIDYLTFGRDPYTGGSGNTNDFVQELTSGDWYVNLLNDDGDDETCDFVDFQFNFNTNGTVTAVSSTTTKNGFWTVTNSSSGIDLVINFNLSGGDDPFDELNDDWDVSNFSNVIIELIDISGGNGGTDLLTFGRDPFSGCTGGGNSQALIDVITQGAWFVGSYIDDGDDETADYNGYNLTFNANGTVIATNGTNNFNGTWSILGSSDLDLLLDFGTQIPFDEFNDDWDVVNFNNLTISLEDVSGGSGATDTLVFNKL